MKMRTLAAIGVSATLVTAVAVNASVPLGVYAVVDKVVLEPSNAEPQRIQIWGTFALWDETSGHRYRPAKRGFLFYSCSKEQIGICRNEWTDLKSVAGTGQVIGFGSRSLLAGRVRAASEQASAPETYPIQFGVVRMGLSPRGDVFDQLKAVARAR